MKKALLAIFSLICTVGKVPEQWNLGGTFPLFKKGEQDDPDNYRGITLLSVVGKVLEAIMNKLIEKLHRQFDLAETLHAGQLACWA